jgi:hypothetical protein
LFCLGERKNAFHQSANDMEQDEPSREESGAPTHVEQRAAPKPRAGRKGADWDAIKHAVLYSGMSYRRIADELGSSDKRIGEKARAEDWVRIVPLQALPCGRSARPPGAPRPKRPTVEEIRRREMIFRLFKVLDGKMREIEECMATTQSGGEPQSAADAEREARALNIYMRLLANAVELAEKAKQGGGDTSSRKAGADDDADRIRRDLARRLERLNQARNA